jgi:serine/threonine protein kinase
VANLSGKSLGNYQIQELLGKGGMAEVYKAYHEKLDRFVTIKVLHPYLVEGEDFLARFEREAKAVAGLRHANIVQIHDFNVEDDHYYMVMEFINGGTLQEKLMALSKTSSYLPVEQVVSILSQVGAALDFAHKNGILHRDIKPSNVLLDSQGNAFLADFGIARMMSTTQFTATGALIGTPTYMSPEQGQGLELDPASDIYSLGIVLFEMLTGKTPFASDTPLAVIHKHIHEPPPKASELRPEIPASVEAVIDKAIAKNPLDRYQSARELVSAFEGALTPELMSKLDALGAPGERPVASLPTMLEQAEPSGQRSELPTEAMGARTLTEVTDQPASRAKAEQDLESESTAGPETDVPQSVAPSKPAAKSKAEVKDSPRESQPVAPVAASPSSSWVARLRSKPVIYGAIGLAVVVILVMVISNLSGVKQCDSVDACIALAGDLNSRGDVEGAINAFGRAADMVPPEEHRTFAWLWCDRATMLDSLGRHDQAEGDRGICDAWDRGE